MATCDDVKRLCAYPVKKDPQAVLQLREHYQNCRACQRHVRKRLREGKVIERVFDGWRVDPKPDLDQLDKKVDRADQIQTRQPRAWAKVKKARR